MLVTIDPDDTELKDAISEVHIAKVDYTAANMAWDRLEPSLYLYNQQFDAMENARKNYTRALAHLGSLIMERL